MKRRILCGALLAVLALAGPVAAQTKVTSFAPLTAPVTNGVWFENDVRPGGTASIVDLTGTPAEVGQPLPRGAANLVTDATNAAKAEVGVVDTYGNAAAILPSLNVSFSYYKAGLTGSPAPALSIKLTFRSDTCTHPLAGTTQYRCFVTLVWEAYTQNHPSYQNPTPDTWTAASIDWATGRFWANGGFGAVSSAGGPPYLTLAEWAAAFGAHPDWATANLVMVSVGLGSYNPSQIGYFDDVRISHAYGAGYSAWYDFDPAPRFATVGDCVSTLISENCATITSGRARAVCNHEQQMECFDMFGVQ